MKRYFLLVFALFCLQGVSAQDSRITTLDNKPDTKTSPPPPPVKNTDKFHLKDHLFVGGNLLLEFGTTTAIGVSPLVGYKITDNLSAGVAGNYIYLSELDYYNNRYKTSVYGGALFAKYKVFQNVFAYAEYGFTSYETSAIEINNRVLINYRINVPDFLVGGGYAQEIGNNSYFEILVAYDLLYNPPYSYSFSPVVIRPGFVFGF